MGCFEERGFRVVLGAALVLICACGGDSAPPQSDDGMPDAGPGMGSDGGSDAGGAASDVAEPTLEYELFDNTTVFDARTLDSLASIGDDQVSLRFASKTAQLMALSAGSVILAGQSDKTPRGLLRLVTSVASDGDGLLLETAPATVFHAFRKLDLDLPVVLGDGADSEPEWSPPPAPVGPVAAASSPLKVTFPIGGADLPLELFDGDGRAATTEDRVAGTGTLRASVTLHFWLHFDWEAKSVEEAFDALGDVLEDLADTFLGGGPPSLGELLNLRTGLRIDGDLEAAVELQGKAALSYHRDRPLGGYTLPAVTIGPLVFVPKIDLEAHFDGGVNGQMSAGASLSAHAGLGFSYDADDGFPKPLVSGPDFTQEQPSATVSASASLRTELELTLRMQLYGLMGPHVSLLAYADLSADRSATPCLLLHAGLEGRSGASIRVFGRDLASFDGPSIELGDPRLLASGACDPLPDPAPTDALITPWSKSYADTVWGTGIDDGWTSLQLHHDGRLLLTSSDATQLLKVEQDGTPVWARSFEQPERPGITVIWPQHATPTLDAGILVSTFQNVLVKLDAAGDVQWGVQLGADTGAAEMMTNAFWSVRRVNDDTWLAGTYQLAGSSERQALLVILAPGGGVERAWTWGGPDHREVVRDILPLADGALLVGQAEDYTGDTHGFVLRVDADGEILWARAVDSCSDEEPVLTTAILTEDGNFIVGGYHYATETKALLFRMAPDGSGDAPAWATATTIDQILGLQPRSLHQLSTGELRVTGRWARTGGNDQVFVAGTDSVGRFSWLRAYGGDQEQAPPTSFITTQGGLMVASVSATLEAQPGGFWLFEVPTPNGLIDLDPASGARGEALTFSSTDACLTTPEASHETTPLELDLSAAGVVATPITPVVHTQ